MKFVASVMATMIENRGTKKNISKLFKFFLFLFTLVLLYSITFHLLMVYVEGVSDHSVLSGVYWTLTVMSTLGFGDITFQSDIGRAFSMVVLLSGILLLLVMLPFTFIQLFYAPWLEAYNRSKTPTEINEPIEGHVLITNFDSVARTLIEKLDNYHYDYRVIVPDNAKALELYESGYKVLVGEIDNPITYRKARFQDAAMLVATGNDMENTNVSFTAREYNSSVPIVTVASLEESLDILKLAGSNYTLQLAQMLGQSLGRRILGGSARVHVIGRFEQLVIGEALAVGTPLVGKKLKDSKLREMVGVNVVGIWEQGKFLMPNPSTEIHDRSVLVLAGSVEQLRNYDENFGIFHTDDKPVLIIGSGRVGVATANWLKSRNMDYRVLDKDPTKIHDPEKFILGDAADLDTLQKAGINEAHTVIITTNRDDINTYLTIYCRKLRPDIQITVRATEDRNVNLLHRAGADFVMSYATMGANAIFNLLQRSEVLMLAEGLNVFRVKTPSSFEKKSIIDCDIRKNTGCSIIAIKENGDMVINPAPNHSIPPDSELILIGNYTSERKFAEYFD